MTVHHVGAAYPVDNLTAAVDLLAALVGEPTVADGDRWARFDIGGTRIMLAGTDRDADTPFLTIKVDDLDDTLRTLRSRGHEIADPHTGPHERRITIRLPGETAWHIAVYEPLS
ncbi:glyoxalase/bleomycin resistance/dioxygenase family protein [Nocardia veterana]|uniref:Glyoxalase/bleomycin resistance/dioxygenase family protein n=1 Tax=Nocardia veterana TaxID=132249 RepID=A0A7X6LTZ6_9NOCA|nr:glyoxalase/bleomycin resistance/dioxygenase family protein [Nocardia veterana]NKY84528.1 glyoxalase/bleomycin resistance/dioxygenase family protein [Nocardia veterana]